MPNTAPTPRTKYIRTITIDGREYTESLITHFKEGGQFSHSYFEVSDGTTAIGRQYRSEHKGPEPGLPMPNNWKQPSRKEIIQLIKTHTKQMA